MMDAALLIPPPVALVQPDGKIPGDFTVSVLNDYLAGLNLSNDGSSPNTVLDVSAGIAADSTNQYYILLASAFTKSTQGGWVAGSGNNGMGNGLTIAASTWYHVFAIINNGVADVYFDTSVTAANKPANTTAFRRIGSFKTDVSVHILGFSQNGDNFLLNIPVNDIINAQAGSTSALTLSLPTAPSGVAVQAIVDGSFTGGSANGVYLISALAQTDTAPTVNGIGFTILASSVSASRINIQLNTSQQFRFRANVTSIAYDFTTHGWIDTRGRFN